MAASNPAAISPVWAKYQACISKPFVPRCLELESILANSSQKDLSSLLPYILENIFGCGPEPGWPLDTLSKSHGVEFDVVTKFLGPEGPLLNFVYKLQLDTYLTYEFPFASLPGPTRHMIEDGSLPMFYVNKLQYQGYSKPVLTLGAFEFYMFHFCHMLVCPSWQSKQLNWNNMADVVYPFLLDKYLHYFLPLNKKSLPKFPLSPASVRSSMMQSPTSTKHSPGSGTQTRSRSRLGLLKANLLSPQKSHIQSPSAEKLEAEIWWSETFVQIVAEFWLHQNTHDVERGITTHSLESFMPSNNHVRLVRLLLKHLHYFVNSVEPEIVASPYSTAETAPLDEFKRSLLPMLLQKKIYCYLRHGFERWPLDSSFRLMLETWLTFIQPWRYKDPENISQQHKETERVDDVWFPFIRDNFLFYSAMFEEFVQRAKRMHLTSLQHAYIIFRVAKVFSLPGFPQMLREVERLMYNSGYRQHQDLGGSCIAPDLTAILRVQISDLERPDFQYINLFGRQTDAEMQHLLRQIHAAKSALEATVQEPEKKSEKSGFAAFFDMSSYFEDNSKAYGDMSVVEVKKVINHLEQTVTHFCQLFGMKPNEQAMFIPQSPGDTSRISGQRSMIGNMSLGDQTSLMNTSMASLPSTPDHKMTSHGPELTEAGRFQLMNGLKKFDLTYQGDPDLQPIRSFENKTLVRVLHKLSDCLNKMFHTEMERLCSRPDLIGKMSQVYLSAPISPSKVPSSPIQREVFEQLTRPRISLRFLGSYQTLIYLIIVYFALKYLAGFGPIGYLMFLVLCTIVYGLFRALTLNKLKDIKSN
ncbi:sphingomyelin phosphodiesterase 4-like isoform X2 [Dreissena polymorpha]|uniref:sphingomyelin phosphodiesterase 4-like isoform X2 n=1 Tax=Dreissena polymorpha TaxID=45954 RepID=UPI0022646650|nr:sphingomyelin phosphodiesterase 4-like isoform X2 [Dreissena polymorpha]